MSRPFQSNDIENRSHIQFRNISDGRFHYHIQNHQSDEKLIAFQTETAFRRSLKTVGVNSYNNTIHLFVFDSPDDIRNTIGVKLNSCAYPTTNCLLCVFSSELNTVASSHKFTHVISHNIWGEPSLLWVSEGLAVLSDDQWHGYDLHPLVRMLKDRGRLVPLKNLNPNSFSSLESNTAYPEAGSFIKFIFQTYGLAAVKKMWREGESTILKGKTLVEIEHDWRLFLDSVQPLAVQYS